MVRNKNWLQEVYRKTVCGIKLWGFGIKRTGCVWAVACVGMF